ncbi:methyl-accepting chemotaxis protein [Undibacterium sp. Di27W]|uniref:methyl-accepting chemotaxis protein n=1 Tax=Undibacterium sp. Di27W TaxID=3413036 RepID=UPI003BF2402D
MLMLRRLKLSRRLAVLIALFSLGFLFYGIWSFRTLSELKVNGPVYERIVKGKDLVADILPPPEYIIESYLVALQMAETEDKAMQGTLAERLKALKIDYDTRHDYWSKADLDSGTADLLLKQAHEPAQAFYNIAFNEFVPALQSQNKEAATVAMEKMKQRYEVHRKQIDLVVAIATKQGYADEVQAKDLIQSATWTLLSILVVSLGIGIVGAALITRTITGPLKEAVCVSQVVASGDLTAQIATHFQDEPGQLLAALKDMNVSLAQTVGQVRGSTEAITTASKQIAAGNLDLSSRTEEQASSLEETASAMEELTSAVKQNADNARQANQLVVSTSEVAIQGGQMVDNVINTMGLIKESSRKIVGIISVIDSIAFQTNILALNAAVEAARAGEQGRGFALVASEVRNLAQRSASAAKEIKELIGDSVEKVDAGSKQVDEAGATMSKILASVKQVADLMGEIAAASHEQSAGIEQVNLAITQMDHVTQQNAALVEEAAAAAASMQEQAATLMREVSVFKLEDDTRPTVKRVQTVSTLQAAKLAQQTKSSSAKQTVITQQLPRSVVAEPKFSAGSKARIPETDQPDWEEF